jgi:hypothetical protein
MDIDNAIALAQKGVEIRFEQRIPIQDVVVLGIVCIQTNVSIRILGSRPLRRVGVIGTIDDMCNSTGSRKPWSQDGTRTHENAHVKVGRGLPKVVGKREHCFEYGDI